MSSRPQVTITLGRDGGQVVKRSRSISADENGPSSWGNQQPRERLGKSTVDLDMHESVRLIKRQRTSSLDDRLLVDMHTKSNAHVGRGDLRLELLKKSSSQGRDNGDLREKLSRIRKVTSRHPSQDHVRAESVQHSLPPRSKDRRMPRIRIGDSGIPSTRSADDLRKWDSVRRSHSPWVLEGQRHRSPYKLFSTSRSKPFPVRYKELQTAPLTTSIDSSRSLSYMRNGLNDDSRSAHFTRRTAGPVDAATHYVRAPPGRMVTERRFRVRDEPLTVEKLLHSLELDKYHHIFRKEEVDITALSQMGDNDLKEMGIPMGPRKKILLAAWAQRK